MVGVGEGGDGKLSPHPQTSHHLGFDLHYVHSECMCYAVIDVAFAEGCIYSGYMKEIDKGVPVPKIVRGRAPYKYPWLSMEIGDSFVMVASTTNRASSRASGAGKKYGRRFTIRKTSEGFRVWRVE